MEEPADEEDDVVEPSSEDEVVNTEQPDVDTETDEGNE